jgi:hypothetical protein
VIGLVMDDGGEFNRFPLSWRMLENDWDCLFGVSGRKARLTCLGQSLAHCQWFFSIARAMNTNRTLISGIRCRVIQRLFAADDCISEVDARITNSFSELPSRSPMTYFLWRWYVRHGIFVRATKNTAAACLKTHQPDEPGITSPHGMESYRYREWHWSFGGLIGETGELPLA